MGENLKACPFDDGEPLRCQNSEGTHREAMFWVLCKKCHASPGDFPTQEQADAAWNRRADPAPSPVTAEQVAGEPVAWLKEWQSCGGAQSFRRVDLKPDVEPWLDNMCPTITPLGPLALTTPKVAVTEGALTGAFDEIEVFRIMRDCGSRKTVDMAEAVAAALSTAPKGEGA